MTSHDKRITAAAAIAMDDVGPKVTQARAFDQRELPLLDPMEDYPTRNSDSVKTPPKRAPDILAEAADTFRRRNALYGDNYLRFGGVFLSMFPDGVLPPVTTTRDMDRLQLMMQALNKLVRYAENFSAGGHQDSARDLCVYAAMLEELTDDRA